MTAGTNDLDALLALAVSRGTLSAAQADDLRRLEAERNGADPVPARPAETEPLRFVGGLNDVFVALGTALVVTGLLRFDLLSAVGTAFLFLGAIWAMAEVLTGRLRRSLPSMICAAAFAWGAANLASLWLVGAPVTGFTLAAPFWPIVGWLAAAALFYVRFRLPFCMFLVGVGVVALSLWQFAFSTGVPNPQAAIAILLVLGVAFLGAAIVFDLGDRERRTVRSDSAFWLHLLAAPLIVHSLVWLAASMIAGTGSDLLALVERLPEIAPSLIALVATVFALAALVALVIDRRALLVSTLIYMTASIVYLVTQSGGGVTALALAPVIIGGAVVVLGTAWRPLRRLVFRVLPLGALEPRLAPLT